MTTRELAKFGVALLVGAAIAFPAGMMVAGAGGGSDRTDRVARQDSPAVRDVFSPSIRRDPWFLDRQREGVEALEDYCARTGESCREARAARRALAGIEAAD